ncbi:hypothetical protein MASR2M36_00150 [Providencia sp.]
MKGVTVVKSYAWGGGKTKFGLVAYHISTLYWAQITLSNKLKLKLFIGFLDFNVINDSILPFKLKVTWLFMRAK